MGKMGKERFRLFAVILVLLTICFTFFSSQTVPADGGIFIDFGEHIYLPSQKAAIFWDGINETLIISTKINSSELTNMAWVTPVQSYVTPQVNEGDIEVFNDIAYSFAEDTGGSLFLDNGIFFMFFILCIIGVGIIISVFFLKKVRVSYVLIILFILIIGASFSFLLYIYPFGLMAGSSYEDVELLEMKTVDFYDVVILKATNATNLISWLEDNKFNVPEDSIPILQEYCDQDDFYFIVNKIDINNSADLFSSVSLEIEQKLENIMIFYENLTISNIYYFRYLDDESYAQFCKNPDSDIKSIALGIVEGKSYTSLWSKYVKDLDLINISVGEYNSLVSKYLRDKNYLKNLYWPYINWLERSIDAELTILWQENGVQKDFKIPNEYSTEKETMVLEDMWECKEYGICSVNKTIMNFLNDSAPKAQNCYQDLKDKLEKSNNFILSMDIYETINNITNLIADFINQPTYKVKVELNESNLLDGTFLNETFSYCINIRNQRILDELEGGIATPLEIVFQPIVPMYPMKMSSINKGNTKINVYFISDYQVKDSSGLLTIKGTSDFSGNPYISTYNVGTYNVRNYVTWLTYEGETKGLIGDSYFVEK